jgi:FHA domain
MNSTKLVSSMAAALIIGIIFLLPIAPAYGDNPLLPLDSHGNVTLPPFQPPAGTATTVPPAPPPPPPPPASTITATPTISRVLQAPPSTPSYLPPNSTGPQPDAGSTALTHHPHFPPPNPPVTPPTPPVYSHHRPHPHPNPNPYPSVSPDYYDYYTWSGNYPWGSPYYYPAETEYYTPVISSFTANPNYIQAGQTSTLIWDVSNADLVSISPSVGSVAASGSIAVIPAYTTTYTLTATNNQGTVTASATVTVAPPYASSYTGGSMAVPSPSGTVYPDTAGTGPYMTSSNARRTVNIGGIGGANPAAQNPWPIYGLLIGLLAVAAAFIIVLLVRKPAALRSGDSAAAKAGYVASATAPASTLPSSSAPVTTPVEADLPAKFVAPGGTTMPVAGKPLGRKDFQSLTSPDKAGLISRQHVLVTYQSRQYYIEDLNSTNGTKLNGSEIRGSGKHIIANGDNVELAGALKLTFNV